MTKERQEKRLGIEVRAVPELVELTIREQTEGGHVFEFFISPYDALGLATSLMDCSIIARVIKNASVIVEGES